MVTKRIAYVLRHRYGIGAEGRLGRDVVLTALHGSPFAPVLFYGVVAAGGVYSGVSTEATVGEIATQLSSSGASMIICSPECVDRMRGAARQVGIAEDRILIADCS